MSKNVTISLGDEVIAFIEKSRLKCCQQTVVEIDFTSMVRACLVVGMGHYGELPGHINKDAPKSTFD